MSGVIQTKAQGNKISGATFNKTLYPSPRKEYRAVPNNGIYKYIASGTDTHILPIWNQRFTPLIGLLKSKRQTMIVPKNITAGFQANLCPQNAIQKGSIIRSFYSLNWSDCKKIAV
jgi:hypothetical protein